MRPASNLLTHLVPLSVRHSDIRLRFAVCPLPPFLLLLFLALLPLSTWPKKRERKKKRRTAATQGRLGEGKKKIFKKRPGRRALLTGPGQRGERLRDKERRKPLLGLDFHHPVFEGKSDYFLYSPFPLLDAVVFHILDPLFLPSKTVLPLPLPPSHSAPL